MLKFIAALAAVLPCLAFGQVDLSITHSTYSNASHLLSDFGAQGRVGRNVYLWGSFEKPSVKLVGQSMGSAPIWGVGAGARKSWDRLNLFGEFGYFMPDLNSPTNIRDEAVWRQLRNDHGEPGWHPEHTVYDLGNAWGGRVGASYEFGHIVASAAYRFLSVAEGLDACTGADPRCKFPVEGKHWQNRKALNLNSVEFGIGLRF